MLFRYDGDESDESDKEMTIIEKLKDERCMILKLIICTDTLFCNEKGVRCRVVRPMTG